MTVIAPKVPFVGQIVVLYGSTIAPTPAAVTALKVAKINHMLQQTDYIVDLHVLSATGNPYKVVGVPYVPPGTVNEPVAEGSYVCHAAPLVITTEIDVATLVLHLQPLVDAAVRAAYADLLATLETKDSQRP